MATSRRPHWLFEQVAADLDYRIAVNARLGNGMTVQVPWNDEGGRAIYDDAWYEPSTVRVAESFLKPGMVFFDVGANIGQYTLLASGIVGRTGAVHSFEPSQATYAWLSKNVNSNHVKNVHLNRLASVDTQNRPVVDT